MSWHKQPDLPTNPTASGGLGGEQDRATQRHTSTTTAANEGGNASIIAVDPASSLATVLEKTAARQGYQPRPCWRATEKSAVIAAILPAPALAVCCQIC